MDTLAEWKDIEKVKAIEGALQHTCFLNVNLKWELLKTFCHPFIIINYVCLLILEHIKEIFLTYWKGRNYIFKYTVSIVKVNLLHWTFIFQSQEATLACKINSSQFFITPYLAIYCLCHKAPFRLNILAYTDSSVSQSVLMVLWIFC